MTTTTHRGVSVFAGTSRLPLIAIGLSVASLAGAILLPPTLGWLLVISGIVAGAAALILAGRGHGADRIAWILLGVGQILNGVGNVGWLLEPHVDVRVELVAQGLFNVATIATVLGMVTFVAPHDTLQRVAEQLLDFVIISGCVFVLCWHWGVAAWVTGDPASNSTLGVLSVVALGVDFIGLALAPLLIISRVRRYRAHVWFAVIALMIAALGDMDLLISSLHLPASTASLSWLTSSLLTMVGATLIPRERMPVRALSHRTGLDMATFAAIATTIVVVLSADRIDDVLRGALAVLIVTAILRQWIVVRANRRLREDLAHEARHDRLTGLANRKQFEARLMDDLDAGRDITLVMCDLDGFKEVNDSAGHEVGDAVLREIADRLTASFAPHGRVFRMGGDEFTVVLPPSVTKQDVESMVRAAQATVAREVFVGPHTLEVTLAAGAARQADPSTEPITTRADLALYRAKASGREGFRWFDEAMAEAMRRRVNARQRLRDAVARGEITYHFQPIVALAGGVRRVEVLLRWLDDDGRQILPPPDVIQEAGVLGELPALSEYALGSVIALAAEHEDMEFSVNFTAREIESIDFVERIVELTERHGVSPERLVIEVTEAEMIDSREVLDALRLARRIGVRVALDDFGTGFSNFSYLLDLPVDELKLDRSFLRGETTGCGRRRAVMASVIDLAHALDLSVTVEGAEVDDQVKLARELGADRVQGYHLSRPVPAERLRAAVDEAIDQAAPAVRSLPLRRVPSSG